MVLGFGYLYEFAMFYFFLFFFFKKQEIIDFKKVSWPKFCNIILLLCLKIGLTGSVDQQINLVSINREKTRIKFLNMFNNNLLTTFNF